MPMHSHDLVLRGAVKGEKVACRLPDAVGGSTDDPCLLAPFGKPVAQPFAGPKWHALRGQQIGRAEHGAGLQRPLEGWQHRDLDPARSLLAGLPGEP